MQSTASQFDFNQTYFSVESKPRCDAHHPCRWPGTVPRRCAWSACAFRLMRQPALGLRPQSKVGNRSHRGTIGHRGFNYGSMWARSLPRKADGNSIPVGKQWRCWWTTDSSAL